MVGISLKRNAPKATLMMVMVAKERMHPANTIHLSLFLERIERIAAMKKVLSPSSEITIMDKAAMNASHQWDKNGFLVFGSSVWLSSAIKDELLYYIDRYMDGHKQTAIIHKQ